MVVELADAAIGITVQVVGPKAKAAAGAAEIVVVVQRNGVAVHRRRGVDPGPGPVDPGHATQLVVAVEGLVAQCIGAPDFFAEGVVLARGHAAVGMMLADDIAIGIMALAIDVATRIAGGRQIAHGVVVIQRLRRNDGIPWRAAFDKRRFRGLPLLNHLIACVVGPAGGHAAVAGIGTRKAISPTVPDLVGNATTGQVLHDDPAERIVLAGIAPQASQRIGRRRAACRLQVLAGRRQNGGLVALQVVQHDLDHAISGIAAPDATAIVIVIEFALIAAKPGQILAGQFAKGVVFHPGVDGRLAILSRRLDDVHQLPVTVVFEALENSAQPVRQRDALPLLGQPAGRVPREILAVAERVGALDDAAPTVVGAG